MTKAKQKSKTGPTLFDFVSDLGYKKKYIYNEGIKDYYKQFIINRAFGQYPDTVLLANECNKMQGLTNEMHYDFLFHTIDKRKRYGKWSKKDNTDAELIEYIKRKYTVSEEVAAFYFKCFDRNQLEYEYNEFNRKGGKEK